MLLNPHERSVKGARGRRRPPAAALGPLLLVICGCGGDPFSYVDVTGSVKYEDGSTIPGAMVTITFEPQTEGVDASTQPRSGMALVNPDGSFADVTSSPSAIGDGIVPGKHKVVIRAFDELENPLDVVPPEYTDVTTTPLEIDTAGQTHFDLVIKKTP
jgi:hypothetical protein